MPDTPTTTKAPAVTTQTSDLPGALAPPGVPYRDRKRYAWLLSLVLPGGVAFGPTLMLVTGDPLTLWLAPMFYYVAAPLLDVLIGEDLSNPPEEAVPGLESDPYYRWITYALVPLLWGAFIFSAWFVSTQALPFHGLVAMVLICGGVGGFCINLGHEMGHKNTPLERLLTKLILAPTFYGHFTVEHNRGHHRDVATPADPASSRMGESIYRFALRELPGAFTRAWALEKHRLANRGFGTWSAQNLILQPALITFLLWGGLMIWLGWQIVAFLLLASLWANFQLTSANYVEHYGLLRKQLSPGKFEPCQPHHSWNSNHVFSNWILFHLQRHSDHHAHPLRRYQSLRHFDNLPTLPNGYFGMFLVAYIPPLWFYVMDERLLARVGRKAQDINLDPVRRQWLIQKYQLI